MLEDTNSMLATLAALLAVGLGLLPYEAPKGKRVSRIFYSLCWCSVAGMLMLFTADASAIKTVSGFALTFVGWAGVFTFFARGGSVYVAR